MEDDSLEISVLNTSGNVLSFRNTHKKAADVFAYLLHQDNVEPSQKEVFMSVVRDGDLPMVNMTKEFAYHLINNMDERERKQLVDIQKEDRNEFGIQNEELTDFVEMEMMDPVTCYRKWEYGKYAMGHFINSFDPGELPTFERTRDTDHGTLTERFASNLANGPEPWEDFVQLFLVQALKYNLNPSRSNMAVYDLIGELVQKNMTYLSIKMDLIRSTFKESLSLSIDQGRGRGRRR